MSPVRPVPVVGSQPPTPALCSTVPGAGLPAGLPALRVASSSRHSVLVHCSSTESPPRAKPHGGPEPQHRPQAPGNSAGALCRLTQVLFHSRLPSLAEASLTPGQQQFLSTLQAFPCPPPCPGCLLDLRFPFPSCLCHGGGAPPPSAQGPSRLRPQRLCGSPGDGLQSSRAVEVSASASAANAWVAPGSAALGLAPPAYLECAREWLVGAGNALGRAGKASGPHPGCLAAPDSGGLGFRPAASCPSGSRCLLRKRPQECGAEMQVGPRPSGSLGCVWFATVDAAGVTLRPAPPCPGTPGAVGLGHMGQAGASGHRPPQADSLTTLCASVSSAVRGRW